VWPFFIFLQCFSLKRKKKVLSLPFVEGGTKAAKRAKEMAVLQSE
jgi:hypothetical protein